MPKRFDNTVTAERLLHPIRWRDTSWQAVIPFPRLYATELSCAKDSATLALLLLSDCDSHFQVSRCHVGPRLEIFLLIIEAHRFP